MLVGPQNLTAKPPRVKAQSPEITNNVAQSARFQQLVNTLQVVVPGMDANRARNIVLMIVGTQRARGGEEFESKAIKKALVDCGMTTRGAKELVRDRLVNVQTMFTGTANFNPNDNEHFRVLPNGRLDHNHLCNVMIKPDGWNEILQGGDDAVSIAIRSFVRGTFSLVHEELDRLQRFETAHRTEERNRLASARVLKTTLMQLDPTVTSERSAQGVLRNFATKKYAALKISEKNTPGFESPTRALTTVASAAQLARRRETSVSDNLTAEAKDADRYMNSAGEADLAARAAEIAAEPTLSGKKRIRNNALSERPSRLAYFNMFAANPADIGNPQAAIDTRQQATRYLDQSTELNNFQ